MLNRRSILASCAIVGLALAGTMAPAPAQAEQFLSLYHRPDLRWYTIETEHFFVHYPESRKKGDDVKHELSGEWAARKVAKVSEQYWDEISGVALPPERAHAARAKGVAFTED